MPMMQRWVKKLEAFSMSQNHKKAFVSWSGGKDSALAYYNAIKGGEIEVAYLLNMLSEGGRYSRSHRLGVDILKAQAQALGIPIVQRQATWGDYEGEFKSALTIFKKEGLRAGVFGDIDVQEHRDWVERVTSESGLNAVLPLWQRSRESLMSEFIAAGFKAVIVTVNTECMGSEWLGREIDRQFIEDMKCLPQIDLCGENGEYHTFVYDGPLFKKTIGFCKGRKLLRGGYCFLEIH